MSYFKCYISELNVVHIAHGLLLIFMSSLWIFFHLKIKGQEYNQPQKCELLSQSVV